MKTRRVILLLILGGVYWVAEWHFIAGCLVIISLFHLVDLANIITEQQAYKAGKWTRHHVFRIKDGEHG